MIEPKAAFSRHQRATLIVTCVGTFMTLLDVAIVNTALPSIQRGLHESFSQLQWVIDAYSLAFAVLLLSSGALADRHGRKRLFQVGMAIFTLGSLLCGLAGSAAELEAARVLQGIGGAALAPASLALLGTAFPDPRQRTKAVATWAAISALGLGIGPTVGGLLVSDAGWRWVFFVNVPVGVLCLAFGVKALAESRNPAARHLDLPGQHRAAQYPRRQHFQGGSARQPGEHREQPGDDGWRIEQRHSVLAGDVRRTHRLHHVVQQAAVILINALWRSRGS